MELTRVNDKNDALLDVIQPLYEESFPIHERRTWGSLLSLLSCPSMQLLYIKEENIFIGFVIVWTIGSWQYMEHFAIDALQRGRKYGSQLLDQLAQDTNSPLILEVEPPHDETARRRIAFYERAGFSTVPFPYMQPPYRIGEQPVPMLLMSRPAITDKVIFNNLSTAIKTQVYEAWHPTI